MKHQFDYTLPLVAFLLSGWFVAAYFALNPGYQTLMSMPFDGTVYNIVSPSLYLYIAVVLNATAWLYATMEYLKGDEE
jgi:hypothetical protein